MEELEKLKENKAEAWRELWKARGKHYNASLAVESFELGDLVRMKLTQLDDGDCQIVRGNGFDGLFLGRNLYEADRFINFVNDLIGKRIEYSAFKSEEPYNG